jgi:hypothetical protein
MDFTPDDIVVVNNPDARRFEARVGDYFALLDYMITGTSIILVHTEVAPALEGQGVGGKLAKTALEFAKEKGYKVVPVCPFVFAYIRRHPEYKSITWSSV